MPIYSEQIKQIPGSDLLIGGFTARKSTGRMYFADITENKDKTADYALYSYKNQHDEQKLVYSKFNISSFYAAYKFAKEHVLKKIGENQMKMIVELISARMTSPRQYDQKTFYKEVQEISTYLGNNFDYILTAMDTGSDDNVKRALIKYIIENDYPLDHIYLILACKWIIE